MTPTKPLSEEESVLVEEKLAEILEAAWFKSFIRKEDQATARLPEARVTRINNISPRTIVPVVARSGKGENSMVKSTETRLGRASAKFICVDLDEATDSDGQSYPHLLCVLLLTHDGQTSAADDDLPPFSQRFLHFSLQQQIARAKGELSVIKKDAER